MKTIVAVVQMRCGENPQDNIARAGDMARRAAKNGARIILLPELFERPYFCKTQRAEFYEYASPLSESAAVRAAVRLSEELAAVVPASFYERAGNAMFNSLALVDGGKVLGVYRKSHIPDGPGYQEKFYFCPGDTGFFACRTSGGVIGAAICWDQWFPEAARVMALAGADVFLYPTAIGEEPHLRHAGEDFDSVNHWQNVMRGHAAANLTPLAAANRIGEETQKDAFGNSVSTRFYGSSFITDCRGDIVAQASREREEVIAAELDFTANAAARAAWGVFRDRRPDLYRPLMTLAGK